MICNLEEPYLERRQESKQTVVKSGILRSFLGTVVLLKLQKPSL